METVRDEGKDDEWLVLSQNLSIFPNVSFQRWNYRWSISFALWKRFDWWEGVGVAGRGWSGWSDVKVDCHCSNYGHKSWTCSRAWLIKFWWKLGQWHHVGHQNVIILRKPDWRANFRIGGWLTSGSLLTHTHATTALSSPNPSHLGYDELVWKASQL